MGRFKTNEERIAKRAKPKDEKRMTQKDWQAIQRDQKAKMIMDHLRKAPMADSKMALQRTVNAKIEGSNPSRPANTERVVTFGHHTIHQKKS